MDNKHKICTSDNFQTCCNMCEDLCHAEDTLHGDIFAVDIKGRSLLHYAARIGNIKLVTLLIKSGINVDTTDDELNTPLFEAVHNGYCDMAKSLIKFGADVNHCNCLGQTSLMLAVMYDDLQIVKVLHKQGSILDKVDCTGKSAILIGLEESRVKSCKYLLNQGCDINVTDKNGRTVFDLLESLDERKNNLVYKKLFNALVERICNSSGDDSTIQTNSFQTKKYFKLFKRNKC